MPLLFTLRKLAIMMVVVCGFLVFLASTAKADSFTYAVNIPNSGLSGSPAPYANVSLTQVFVNQGTTVCTALAPCINVNVTMLTNASGGTYELFGNGNGNGAFGFNIVGSTGGLAVTNLLSDAGAGAASGLTFDATGGNFDGFGPFELST